jgi:hypothetical protein
LLLANNKQPPMTATAPRRIALLFVFMFLIYSYKMYLPSYNRNINSTVQN